VNLSSRAERWQGPGFHALCMESRRCGFADACRRRRFQSAGLLAKLRTAPPPCMQQQTAWHHPLCLAACLSWAWQVLSFRRSRKKSAFEQLGPNFASEGLVLAFSDRLRLCGRGGARLHGWGGGARHGVTGGVGGRGGSAFLADAGSVWCYLPCQVSAPPVVFHASPRFWAATLAGPLGCGSLHTRLKVGALGPPCPFPRNQREIRKRGL